MNRRRPHLALLVTATALAAVVATGCGGGTPGSPSVATKATGGGPAASTTATAAASATAAAHTPAAAGTTAKQASAQPTVPPRALNANLGVTAVQTAADIAPDGSPRDARNVFHATTDHRVVAVLSVSGLKAGTKISFVRWLDGKFVDTRGAALRGTSSHFYFEFTAAPGKTIHPGTYRLRLYVDGKAAAETSYQVV
jgi:hypothetical protein